METQTLHFLGVASFTLGSYIQQLCFSLKSLQRNSSASKHQVGAAPILPVLGFVVGMALEVIALALLPLSSHILLASLHVFWFNMNIINREARPYFHPELIGSFAVLMSSLLTAMAAGYQAQVQAGSEYDALFNGPYFLWMLSSLAFNLTLRKLGFYKGKVLLETCLPAQISAFAYGAAKMLVVSLDMHSSGDDPYIGLLTLVAFVLATSMAVNSAVIWHLCTSYDIVVVIGSYYLWLVCYALPLALCVVNAGVQYTWVNYGVTVLAAGGVCGGVCLMTYSRMDYIQTFKKSQLVSPPPSSYRPAPPPNK